MPLEEVLKRYSNTEQKVKKALKKKVILKPGPSPMISKDSSKGSSSRKHLAEQKLPNQTAVDFQKQEEIDINEIKFNSGGCIANGSSALSTSNNHEQDFDEASNLVSIFYFF